MNVHYRVLTSVILLGSMVTAFAQPEPRVARAQFTSAVVEREPVDDLVTLNNQVTKANFFSELRGLTGETVTHRWEYQGRVVAEIPFEVGGDRWRVFSSKTLDPSWLGQWTVVVVDGKGLPLKAVILEYTEGATRAVSIEQ